MGHKPTLRAISRRWSALCSNSSRVVSKLPSVIRDSSHLRHVEVCQESLSGRSTLYARPQAAAGDVNVYGLRTLFFHSGLVHKTELSQHNVRHCVEAQKSRNIWSVQSVEKVNFCTVPEARQLQQVDSACRGPTANAQAVRFSSSSSWIQKAQAYRQAFGRGNKEEVALPEPAKSASSAATAEDGPKRAAAGLRYQSALDIVTGKAGPIASVIATASRYREVAGLQVESFLRRNWMPIVGIAGVGTAMLLWRGMFRVVSLFVTISEGMAYWGFFALSASIVTFAGLFVKRLITINPDAVHRTIMRQLNSSAAALEVMGAPLAGSDLRAYLMSGGGLRFKRLRPRLATRRCFLVFPVRGSEKRALVCAEVKKKNGKYHFKLLALDVPTATAGQEQRLFLVGDQAAYENAGTLIADLRDPLLEGLKRQKEFEVEDDREHEEDARLRQEEKQRKAREAAARRKEKEAEERAQGL